jgi:hypothetical protein
LPSRLVVLVTLEGLRTEELVLEKFRALESKKRNLLQLRRDLARQEYLSVEPVYALDFSEVMAYIAPIPAISQPDSVWHSYGERFAFRSPDASLILDLLAKINTAFFLPIGSIHELREFLRYFFPRLVKRSALDDSIDNFRGVDNLRTQLQRLDMAAEEISEALSKSKANQELDRLHALYVRVCRPVSQIRSLVGSFDLDERAFHFAIRELTRLRPEYPRQNRVDAINFSMVSHLSDGWTDHRQIFFLITRKRPFRALRAMRWETDPLEDFPAVALSETPPSQSLVRDIPYLGYAALAASAKRSLDERIEFVEDLLASVQEEAASMVSGAGNVRLRRGAEQGRSSRTAEQEELGVMFEQLASQFAEDEEWLDVLRQSDVELTAELAEERYREIERRIREDIDSFSSLADKAGGSRDIVNAIVRPPLTNVSFIARSSRGKYPAFDIVAETTGEPVGSVLLNSDYFAIEIRTASGRFDSFVRLAADLYAFMSERDSARTMRMAHKLLPPGLLLISQDRALFVPMDELKHPLEPEEIWSVALSNDLIPRQARFSSPYFDLHYEIIPKALGESRASFVSHLAVPEVVATYFARMMRRLVTVEEVLPHFERFLSEELGQFQPYVTVD